MSDLDDQRSRMVRDQIRSRGIKDPRILSAFESVPRHLFVAPEQQKFAYEDHPLPIGLGQTISQPYIVALMTELLDPQPEHTVLEIGAGSGYQAAVLSRVAGHVISVERMEELAKLARRNLAAAEIDNVDIQVGDGTLGWPARAPYERIIVTAAAPELPRALADQLTEGGRLVIPMGSATFQELYVFEKHEGKMLQHRHGGCRFVKLIGKEGWGES
jgi:protein-L-isoaspartate(D-aspartate) O-methyltransferase